MKWPDKQRWRCYLALMGVPAGSSLCSRSTLNFHGPWRVTTDRPQRALSPYSCPSLLLWIVTQGKAHGGAGVSWSSDSGLGLGSPCAPEPQGWGFLSIINALM